MVAEGYKQTEIGIIPEDWKLTLLGNLGTFSKGSGVKKDEAKSGNIPCVRYGEIYTHHHDYIKSFNSYISESVSQNAKKLKIGDLLFAGSGETKEEIGKCVAFLDDEDTYAGGDIVILTPRNVNSKFFGYLLNSPIVVKQKASKGQGDAVVHISANSLSKVLVPIPPKSEQQAIATALSDVDGLIASLESLIKKKENIKTATMQQLLTGKKRLDGFSGEWVEQKLGEYVTITSGDSPSKFDFQDRGMPYYKVEQLNYSSKYLNNDTPYFIDPTGKKVVPGSVIFPKRGAAIFLNKIRLLKVDSFFDTNLMALTTNDKLSHEFLFYILSYIGLERVADTTSVPQINNKHINPFVIPLPILDEQVAIVSVLSDMDKELDVLKARLQKTKVIKTGMMQELLTGKTRLL